jgi:hypothetical protein
MYEKASCSYLMIYARIFTIVFYFFSLQEKSDLKKVHDEAEDAAEKQKGKVTVTFDLVGRKVVTLCSRRLSSWFRSSGKEKKNI